MTKLDQHEYALTRTITVLKDLKMLIIQREQMSTLYQHEGILKENFIREGFSSDKLLNDLIFNISELLHLIEK
jgi:hypothetical protein